MHLINANFFDKHLALFTAIFIILETCTFHVIYKWSPLVQSSLEIQVEVTVHWEDKGH